MASSPAQDVSTLSANKRSSGRVRKQPEAYTSLPFVGNAKRKRTDRGEVDDGDRAMPEDYESEEDDIEEDDEPDEEELREQRQKARKPKSSTTHRPAQKKTKVTGTSVANIRTTTVPRKRQAKKARPLNAANAAAVGGLYAEVFASGTRFEDIASEWLARFDEHESRAVAEIVNFVLKCAGCDGTVAEHDIEDPDGVTNKLDELRDEYQATEPTDYPLIAKGKSAAAFKQSVTGLMHAVIKAINAKGLLHSDSGLIDTLQVWFSTMSSAPNPSFRHTATVVCLTIVSAICEVGRENILELANSQRHAETERKKPRANKARVLQLEDKVREKASNKEMMEYLLRDWFDVLFIHRYRDVNPLIRRDCVVALGDWIVTIPDVFFDGNHLRYLGWVLSDTVAATRVEVVKQLHRFYKEQDMISGLKIFTEKFRSRLVEIATTDAEISVRTATIELLDVLREHGLLEPDDIDAVGRMVFDADVRIRKAVAIFFTASVTDLYSSKVDDLGGEEALAEALPETGEDNHETPRLEWLKFKSLAEMLQSYDVDDNLPSYVERNRGDGRLTLHVIGGESRFTLAANVLYDAMDEMSEWQILAGYLLFDHSSGRSNGVASDAFSQMKHECILTEKEETILLEVLNASIKRNLAELADSITAPKSKLSKKAKEGLEEEQEDAAHQLVILIPRLLKKFGDSPSTAAAVLRIESVFNLPSLREIRQDSATYGALLDDVRKQFMSHGTDEVLAPASTALVQVRSNGDLDELTEDKITALWEDVVSSMAELINSATVTVRGASEAEELISLNNNLLRIIRLASVSDCTTPLEDDSVASTDNASQAEYHGAIDYIIALVQRARPSSGTALDATDAVLEDQIAARAAEAGLLYFSWTFKNIINSVTDAAGTGISDDDLINLATRRDAFVDNIRSVLQHRKAGDEICGALVRSMMDLFSYAAFLKSVEPKAGINDEYTVLALKMEDATQKEVLKVFTAAEKHYAKLSGKKLEEATTVNDADDDDAEAVNDDPVSDPESDEEDEDEPTQNQTQTQASQQRREAKMLATVLAEQNLCSLVGRFVKALAADVMDQKPTRARLERNKAKLGPNYKACCEWLDLDKVGKSKSKSKSKAKSKAPANGVAAEAKRNPKSNAIIAEDELDDEIEDPDAEDDEALRRRELITDDDLEPEQEDDAAATQGPDAEVESVLGD